MQCCASYGLHSKDTRKQAQGCSYPTIVVLLKLSYKDNVPLAVISKFPFHYMNMTGLYVPYMNMLSKKRK